MVETVHEILELASWHRHRCKSEIYAIFLGMQRKDRSYSGCFAYLDMKMKLGSEELANTHCFSCSR